MPSKKVLGFHYGGSESALPGYRYDLVSTLAFFSYSVDPDTALFSSLNGWDTTNAIATAHANGSRVVLVASNFTPDGNAAILSDASKRGTLATSLIQQVQSRGGDGILIDFENVTADQGANLTTFLTDLAAQLRAAVPNAELGIALSASPTSAFDPAAISNLCDYAVAMTYNYSWAKSAAAGAVAPLPSVTANLQKYLDSGFPPTKLLMGVPYYGFDWQTDDTTLHSSVALGSDGNPIAGMAKTYPAHKAAAAQYGRNFDDTSSSPWYSYTDPNSNPHVAWYDDPVSLALKYTAVQTMGLGGIGIWNIVYGKNSPELWDAISNAFASFSESAHAMNPGNAALVQPTGSDLVAIAARHLGEPYLLNSLAPKDNPNWRGPWNCSEFASWCVYQTSNRLYGCETDSGSATTAHAFTGYWSRDANGVGTRISAEDAAATPGAVLLRLGTSTLTGHAAFSDGTGGTVEAHSQRDGVVRGKVSGRHWDFGILVPWVHYEKGAPVSITPPVIVYRVKNPPMEGNVVKLIQGALRAAGFDPGPIDGIYGTQTATACTAFQTSTGLTPDGQTGPATAALLRVALS